MPYKSKAQMRFLHAKKPEIAKKWDAEHSTSGELPEKKKSKRKK